MLELGKRGSAGVDERTMPVLSDGVVVGTLPIAGRRSTVTATVGDRAWVFGRQRRELTARRAGDPEHSVRLRARKATFWGRTWAIDLEGRPMELVTAAGWTGSCRLIVDGRQIAEGGTTGGSSPRPTLTADVGVPLDHQVFVLWLVAVARRRGDGGDGGSGGDGGWDDGGGWGDGGGDGGGGGD